VEIELSVTFAPELRDAVREAADEAGLSLSDWLAHGNFLDEWQAEHGAFTEEEMARARRDLGYEDPE
jgi:hypothetical protein